MTFGPLFVLALVFCAFAAFDWRRLPFCARASLAAATVFAIAGFQYPAPTSPTSSSPTATAWPTWSSLARAVGFAAVLVSLAFLVRGATER